MLLKYIKSHINVNIAGNIHFFEFKKRLFNPVIVKIHILF